MSRWTYSKMDNNISHLRRQKGIKQNDMARDINVSPSYLCKVEKGQTVPGEDFIEKCAEYLEVSPDALFKKGEILVVQEESEEGSYINRLWEARRKRKMKQYELARMLGCSPSYLSRIEKGLQQPTIAFRKRCAKILKIKEIELFN